MLLEIFGILSFLERENHAIGSLYVICKMFPYMSIRVDQVRPCRTCQLSSLLV